MEILWKPTWWIPALLALLHQIGQYRLGWKLAWVDAYLDPLLCLPVFLGLWLVERRVIFRVPRLNVLEIVIAGLSLAVLFEEGFPRWQPAFVRDGWDYLAYAIGGAWFWWGINPRAEKDY